AACGLYINEHWFIVCALRFQVYFFFQAEDGIRDLTVTGVQTCALPISGVIFARDEAVAPDVVWVGADRLHSVLWDDGKLHAAPDLMVEVLSPGQANEERDRELKLDVYSRRGVREYWIASWQAHTVELYRRED